MKTLKNKKVMKTTKNKKVMKTCAQPKKETETKNIETEPIP